MSYKLSPRGTKVDMAVARKNLGWFDRVVANLATSGATHFAEPVHEEITNRIYNCGGDDKLCSDPNSDFAGPYILAGVRWNDDPPFQLNPGEASNLPCKTDQTIRFTTQPLCWDKLFKDAEKKAAQGVPLNAASHASLLARSHYGDLQFLHAMASRDGELANETRDHIMMWAEFTWKVSHGDYSPTTRLADVDVVGFKDFFGGSGKQVQDLFALGNGALRNWIPLVAFGSLLHMMEDSFAEGHAERAALGSTCSAVGKPGPGLVKEFHSYPNQDPNKHGEWDKKKSFLQQLLGHQPTAVDVGKVLVEYRNSNSSWEQVKPYLTCAFQPSDLQAKASAGNDFKRDH